MLGKILDIDLTTETWKLVEYPQDLARKYLGGRGFNMHVLYHQLPANANPLGPENLLILSCGLLTGTAAPSSARLHINALSPLTGILGSSNVGGNFGPRLRSNGIQSVILRGKSHQPVYLWIDGEAIEIRKAKSLWGLDTWQTEDRLKANRGGDKISVLAIGPGGENGALFGCIMSDRDHAAGRTGMGTVMGSKNVKAIVVKKQGQKASCASDAKLNATVQRYLGQIKTSPHYAGISKYGGASYVKWADDLGILATRNYRQNTFEAAERIDAKNLKNNIIRRRSCHRCPVHCKADLEFSRGKYKGMQAVRPEFESMLALGSKCGLSDLDTLIFLDNLCSRLGLDNISAGNAIAFAMDLFERGIISLKDTGGVDLAWGNGDAMETLIRQMAALKGFGQILAKGVRRASQLIGNGAEHYAPHVKGLEMAGYHPDNIMGTALGYAVASRGADFNDVFATLEYKWLPQEQTDELGAPRASDLKSIHGKAELVRRSTIIVTALDGLGLCKVPALCLICAYDLVAEAELAAAITGWPLDASALFISGERIVNMERLFNLRYGASSADDRLPDMFFEKDYNAGEEPSKPQTWMEPMIKEFYDVMGWDQQGQPTPEKLADLGIISLQHN
ncbi:MAG: aldehyde ferredoxin oxidoreductase family protein [Desulfobacterales bacterium]